MSKKLSRKQKIINKILKVVDPSVKSHKDKIKKVDDKTLNMINNLIDRIPYYDLEGKPKDDFEVESLYRGPNMEDVANVYKSTSHHSAGGKSTAADLSYTTDKIKNKKGELINFEKGDNFYKFIKKAFSGSSNPKSSRYYKGKKWEQSVDLLSDRYDNALSAGALDTIIEKDHSHHSSKKSNFNDFRFLKSNFPNKDFPTSRKRQMEKEVRGKVAKKRKSRQNIEGFFPQDASGRPKGSNVLSKINKEKKPKKEYGDGTNIPYNIRKPVYNPEEEGNKAAARALSSVTNDLNMVTKKHSLEDFFNDIIDNEFKK